jgi:hypothetical protein
MGMKLVLAPDKYTCVAAAVAMATRISLDEILDALYTKLEFPFQPPYDMTPKVPTTDEIGEWLYTKYRIGIMPFNRNPVCSPAPGIQSVPVWLDGDEAWFRHLRLGWGLLEGRTRDRGHMCAWDRNQVFDPRGYQYDWESRAAYGFDAHTFWLVC